jgi:NTE family protein
MGAGSDAVVIAGAGARGAYEAGALAALLPHLVRHDHRPGIYIGTSAGAINAVLLAAHAHEPPDVAARALTELWRDLRCHDLWRPLPLSAPGTALRYGAEFVGLRRPRLVSLLDTSPLATTARRWQREVQQAHANVRDGVVRALAVATTDVYRGRTVVYADLADGVALPPTDTTRAIDYVRTPVTLEHVLASAAIPIAFPAIALPHPAGERWYSDGGVRLNTPLKPAIALGAERLVVVATHPADPVGSDQQAPDDEQPEVDDHLVNILDAVLVDRMVEDLRTLRTVNRALRQAGPDATGGGTAAAPRSARRRLRELPYLFVGPERRETLGALATEVFAALPLSERLRPFSCASDLGLIRRLLASGEGPRGDDPLSFLFFHPAFADAALDLGASDTEQAMAAATARLPWRT